MSSKLFVGGLPWAVTSDQLRDHFAAHGDVVEAKVVTDRQTGRSRGFGFVTYGSEEEAQNALALDGQEFEGRRLRVELARDRERGRGPR
jgi:RNA recognition motif-containing protein